MDQAIRMIAQSASGRLIASGQFLNLGKTQRVTVSLNGTSLTWYQVIDHWQQESDFRSLITQVLRDSPYSAFFGKRHLSRLLVSISLGNLLW